MQPSFVMYIKYVGSYISHSYGVQAVKLHEMETRSKSSTRTLVK